MTATLIALAGGAALTGYAAWAERRPRDRLEPSMVPTTPVMFAGILVMVLALVHLLSLFGVETGRQR